MRQTPKKPNQCRWIPLDTSENKQKSFEHALSYFVTQAHLLAVSTKIAGFRDLNLSKSIFRSVKVANTTICRKTKPQKDDNLFLLFCFLSTKKNIRVLILSSVFSGSWFSGFSKKLLANYTIANFFFDFCV